MMLITSTKSFNSRAREGRDCGSLTAWGEVLQFQLTRPRGARHQAPPHPRGRGRFNSRAREGRDAERPSSGVQRKVSTHAPARGATAAFAAPSSFPRVSTHAPARGATTHRSSKPVKPISFNSRAREGRDALACVFVLRVGCFNSRAREGRDFLILSPLPL